MTPAIRFPDGQLAVRDLLRALLSGRDEPEVIGAVVSTKPLPGSDEERQLPHVQVSLDGSARDSRLNGRATVRVTVTHRDEGRALALAALCEALLLAYPSGEVRSASPVAGPIPVPDGDPDTGLPLAFFSITARLRPHQFN